MEHDAQVVRVVRSSGQQHAAFIGGQQGGGDRVGIRAGRQFFALLDPTQAGRQLGPPPIEPRGQSRPCGLDEPTVGLDPVLRIDLWDRFHPLAAAGTTLFVSSHVIDEAGRCDRLLLMRAGELIADGSPATLQAATGAHDIEGRS